MATKAIKKLSTLTPTQARRLAEMRACNGRSYLADQENGMHAARAWWSTMEALERRGAVRRMRRVDGSGLISGFELVSP
jgi:hypothetical protein